MGTVPTPLDATAGNKITATAFDAGVKDVLNFLLDTYHCDVHDGVGVVMTNATATLMTYDSEVSDTDSMHSTSSNTGRIVFNTVGRWDINVFVTLPAATYTTYDVNLRLNSGGSAVGGTSIRTFSYGSPGGAPRETVTSLTRVMAVAGDYIEVFITQTSGSNRTTSGGLGVYANGFQARWVGLT